MDPCRPGHTLLQTHKDPFPLQAQPGQAAPEKTDLLLSAGCQQEWSYADYGKGDLF
jgi:hypothetical protein